MAIENTALETKRMDTGSSRTGEGISRDDLFEVLRNRRRRLALQYLTRSEGTASLGDVVDYVTSQETDTPVGELDPRKRKAVYTALRQSHLPKMDKLGVVEYDHLRGEVRSTGAAQEVQAYIDHRPKDGNSWNRYYLGLATFTLALLTITWLDVVPIWLSWQLVAVVSVFLFGGFAAYHTYHVRGIELSTQSSES